MTSNVRLGVIWSLMVAATAASFVTSREGWSRLSVVAVLVFAYFKCRLVVMEFMEVSHAPAGWRIFFEAWMLFVSLEILFFWLSA